MSQQKTIKELLESSDTLLIIQDGSHAAIYTRDKEDPKLFNKAEAAICFATSAIQDEKSHEIISVVKGPRKSIMGLWMTILDEMRAVDTDCFSEIFDKIGVGGGSGSPIEAIAAVIAGSNVILSAAIGRDLIKRNNSKNGDVGKSLDKLLES